MNQIYQCSEKALSKLCIRNSPREKKTEALRTVLLHGSNRLDGWVLPKWNDGFYRLVPFTYSHIHEVRRESSSTQNLRRETQITSGYARMHESAANVDGKSTGKPAASDEAVDGYVLT